MNGPASDLLSGDQVDTVRPVAAGTESPPDDPLASQREATDHRACGCKQAPVVAWQLCPED